MVTSTVKLVRLTLTEVERWGPHHLAWTQTATLQHAREEFWHEGLSNLVPPCTESCHLLSFCRASNSCTIAAKPSTGQHTQE